MAVADVAELAEKVRPVSLTGQRLLPVVEPLRPLLPAEGLPRGSTTTTSGSASLALALVAEASAAGSWVAAVGWPSLGVVAAAEAGVALERFVLVAPGDRPATVVAALLDGFDVVLLGPSARVGQRDARRLVSRTREREAVLVVADRSRWAESPDVRFTVVRSEWEGVGRGHGHLRARRAEVVSQGRRTGGRERRAWLWLPGPDGRIATCPTDAGFVKSTAAERSSFHKLAAG